MKINQRVLKNNRRKEIGFTLLELLVVISIIGILIALGAVSYTTAQKKGRDAKRHGDLKAVQNAFEQYYAENLSSYGANCSSMATADIMPAGLPTDPKNIAPYQYNFSTNDAVCDADSYCLCSRLEIEGTGNATDNACSFSAGGNYYCLSNLQ